MGNLEADSRASFLLRNHNRHRQTYEKPVWLRRKVRPCRVFHAQEYRLTMLQRGWVSLPFQAVAMEEEHPVGGQRDDFAESTSQG
jgi:hypothetical protein